MPSMSSPTPSYDAKKQELQERMNKTLTLGDQTVQMSSQTLDIAAMTEEELARQGEALQRIEDNLDTINSNAYTGQRILTRMGSFFGGWIDYFTNTEEPPATRSRSASQPTSAKAAVTSTTATTIPTTKPSNSVRPPVSSEVQEFLEKSDQQFDFISQNLDGLKASALSLNTELDRQNKKLDVIDSKASQASVSIQQNNQRIRKML